MTLIIAGYEIKEDPWSKVWGDMESELGVDGLFAVADSVITVMGSNGVTPILSGLRKIHPVAIKLWKPYFVREDFRDYFEVYLESNCFIAFAGSTLIASHVLNNITEHLSKLQISYQYGPNSDEPGKYIVQMHCQENILKSAQNMTWSTEMFLDRHYDKIITAEYILDIIEYSINKAISSARKYQLTPESIKNMHTEFIAGVHCPATNQHQLYVYRMDKKLVDGMLEVFVKGEKILENKVAVIGMRKQFEDKAQKHFEDALNTKVSPGDALYKFLNKTIDEVSESGSFAIDRPSVYTTFKEGIFKKDIVTRNK